MFSKVKSFVSNHKGLISGAAVSGASALAAVPTFAADASGFIQASWVADLLPSVTADVGTMMPIGIGIMALFLGVRIVPRIVYSFM